MSEKSCIFAAFFSAIRYYLCGIYMQKVAKYAQKQLQKVYESCLNVRLLMS